MQGYGQFCTVARGAEVLCERWTPLVVRELLIGSHRFNDLHRGVPRMSTSLLAQRLRQLEDCGVVERKAVGKVWEYHLTAAGEELRPLIMGLGQWGARWIGSRLREGELDAGLLLWDMRRSLRLSEFPPTPVVVQFLFRDGRSHEREWWLVVEDGAADLCREDPGREITLVIDATLRALTEIWSGDDTPQQAMAAGALRVQGPHDAANRLWRWIGVGTFAQARRMRPGPDAQPFVTRAG
jgi:DNA-binding HxlR family transcriptional regulator